MFEVISMKDKKQSYSIGEAAKMMNVSVRTLRYYDECGLLKPSGYLKNNHRYYLENDILLLHQIISLKEFGLSLSQIKDQLLKADSIEDVDHYLLKQQKQFENELIVLKNKATVLKKFRQEMKQMNELNWKLLIEILTMLNNNDHHYWVIKHFDEDVYQSIKDNYVQKEGSVYYSQLQKITDEILANKKKGFTSYDQVIVDLVLQWWDAMMSFTNNDFSVLQNMNKVSQDPKMKEDPIMKKFKMIEDDIKNVLERMFEQNSEVKND